MVNVVCLYGCITDKEPETQEYIKVGDKLPYFDIVTSEGVNISTSDLVGRRGIIVLFNTSCNDCRKELPIIQKLYDEIISDKLPDTSVLCISREESASSVAKFWETEGLSLPYSAQTDKSVYNLFADSVIPRIYIYSSTLTVTATFSDSPLPTLDTLLEALSATE